ncbi:hypothetical protein M3Y94_00064800 [Aphelenchoides besseyi]|nr:hypothetical protein M3Y94_00064800 [Aphelenchoides besseyi]
MNKRKCMNETNSCVGDRSVGCFCCWNRSAKEEKKIHAITRTPTWNVCTRNGKRTTRTCFPTMRNRTTKSRAKDINVEELQKEANSPDDLLRLSKKGQAIMMFITVTEGTDGKATRPFTDRMSQLWQSNLYNNHIDVQSYVVEDDRILFLFKDGSRAWEGRDYILKQPNCLDITLEGNTIPGAGSKKHTEL